MPIYGNKKKKKKNNVSSPSQVIERLMTRISVVQKPVVLDFDLPRMF